MTAPRVAAVIGFPVGHSRSPAMHNAAYRAVHLDAIYRAEEVAPGRVALALERARELDYLGLNVTVPHKREAFERCDELDDDARALGAVNTVVFTGQRIRGANTDVEGFGRALDERLAVSPARAVVLGSGGAARAVVAALARRRTACTVVARDLARARDLVPLGARGGVAWTTPSLAAALDGADLLVDATSAALSPENEAEIPAPVPLDVLAPHALVVSLVYHRQPALLASARGRGLATLDGASMLVHQAARAFTLMTGLEAPMAALWEGFRSGDRADR